ncbi:MAG: DUF2065 family protein [Pseudomonadota bacterium]
MIATLCLGVGLVLIIEGLVWWLAPSLLDRLAEVLRDLPLPTRRQMGMLAVVSGLIFLWMAHWLGGFNLGSLAAL